MTADWDRDGPCPGLGPRLQVLSGLVAPSLTIAGTQTATAGDRRDHDGPSLSGLGRLGQLDGTTEYYLNPGPSSLNTLRPGPGTARLASSIGPMAS